MFNESSPKAINSIETSIFNSLLIISLDLLTSLILDSLFDTTVIESISNVLDNSPIEPRAEPGPEVCLPVTYIPAPTTNIFTLSSTYPICHD